MNRLHPVTKSTAPIFRVALGLAAAWIVGCGGDSDRLQTAPVHGTVSYNGQPLTRGSITFVPTQSGPTATGQIQPDGTYSLTTYEEGDGAILGSHRVMIVSMDEGSGLPEDAMTEPKLLIPDKYGRDQTSGLTADVTEGDNEIDFPLKD